MKKIIAIVIMLAFVLGIGIYEEVFLKDTTKKLYTYTDELHASIESDEENINREENKQLFIKLRDFWLDAEKTLCLLVNYENVKCITEAIAKLEISINENDLSVTHENINALKYYSRIMKNVYGFSWQNIL